DTCGQESDTVRHSFALLATSASLQADHCPNYESGRSTVWLKQSIPMRQQCKGWSRRTAGDEGSRHYRLTRWKIRSLENEMLRHNILGRCRWTWTGSGILLFGLCALTLSSGSLGYFFFMRSSEWAPDLSQARSQRRGRGGFLSPGC